LSATGVITGSVSNSENEPQVGVSVLALETHYSQGSRRLGIIGQVTTDDRGQYRIYGLKPGQYYVCAFEPARHETMRRPKGAPPQDSYISTFYPNVHEASKASPIRIQPASEMAGINISLLRSPAFHSG
jgi:hypothetical protein